MKRRVVVYLVMIWLTGWTAEGGGLTLCQMERDPTAYSGRLVTFRASVVGRRPVTVFDYDAPGCTQQLLVVQPSESISGGLTLDRDENFGRFQSALRRRTRINATFAGRFEYSKSRRPKMRLVLQRVSDLSTIDVPSIDR